MHASPSAHTKTQRALARRDTNIMESRHDSDFLGYTIISLTPGLARGLSKGLPRRSIYPPKRVNPKQSRRTPRNNSK
jgi:hypothetical protein